MPLWPTLRIVASRRWARIAAGLFLAWFLLAGKLLVVERPIDNPDLIMVLAGHEWDRLPAAASLALANPDAQVVVSWPLDPTPYNCHRCGERVAQLIAAGVDRRRIVELVPSESNTRGEAEAVAAYAQQTGKRRLLAVTSVYHTRRTDFLLRQAVAPGMTAGVVGARRASPHRPLAWWSRPGDIFYVSYEWAAILKALVT